MPKNTPPNVTGRPTADSQAAYMTAELVKGRIKSVARKPAAAVAISGVRYAKFDVFSCSAKVNQAKARPYSVADGLSALEKARALHPDIIFMDIRIPKLDGLTVLERLRADDTTTDIPVVILSNWNEKELVERGVKLGALDHLIKSQTTPARLSNRLKEWLKT